MVIPILLTIIFAIFYYVGRSNGYWAGYQDGYHEVDKQVLPPEDI